jgi:hypothetical protein
MTDDINPQAVPTREQIAQAKPALPLEAEA